MDNVAAVIVTGAGGTIGRAIVRRLAARGVPLVITDLAPEALRLCVDELDRESPGVPLVDVAIDLTVSGASREVVALAEDRFGGIQGCVNTAGIVGPVVDSRDLTSGLMDPAFHVNVHSVVELCAAAIATMIKRERGGRIVNVASGAALTGAAHMVTYHASKHAVLGATRSLAREYAPHSISVNAVCPGYVQSPMVDSILARRSEFSGHLEDPSALIPAGRFGRPDEMASVVEYLTLDAPTYMTGAAIVVDGGLYA